MRNGLRNIFALTAGPIGAIESFPYVITALGLGLFARVGERPLTETTRNPTIVYFNGTSACLDVGNPLRCEINVIGNSREGRRQFLLLYGLEDECMIIFVFPTPVPHHNVECLEELVLNLLNHV